MSNFTPGPWNVSRLATPSYAPEFAIYADGGVRDLALVIGENSEGNAKLIAAAPKLLEACKEVLTLMHIAFDYEGDVFGLNHNDAVDAESLIRKAINEATGE